MKEIAFNHTPPPHQKRKKNKKDSADDRKDQRSAQTFNHNKVFHSMVLISVHFPINGQFTGNRRVIPAVLVFTVTRS